MTTTPEAKMGHHGMTVFLDSRRMEYLSAKRDWDEIHTNELIPLGRVLDFMVQGHSQRTAINKTIQQYRRIRDDVAKSRKVPLAGAPHIECWPDGYKHLSYDSFQKRIAHFKCVLPYVHIYFRNRDYNAWADALSEECNPVILPHEFSAWNATLWEQFEHMKRVRLRAPNEKISLIFQ